MYIGRTNDFRGRYGRHYNPGASHRMAAFAFRLAREATGKLKATYRTGDGSRDALATDPEFSAAFFEAETRIRSMSFRYVEEAHPIRQCLLEVYAAVVLATPYNDFDNHRALDPRDRDYIAAAAQIMCSPVRAYAIATACYFLCQSRPSSPDPVEYP